eukprot:7146136-Alexandrium_andersonii.AAC.1
MMGRGAASPVRACRRRAPPWTSNNKPVRGTSTQPSCRGCGGVAIVLWANQAWQLEPQILRGRTGRMTWKQQWQRIRAACQCHTNTHNATCNQQPLERPKRFATMIDARPVLRAATASGATM